MARFEVSEGLDGLILSMREAAAVPDSVRQEILAAGGKVLVDAQRAYLRQHHSRTGKLADSIGYLYKQGRGKGGGPYGLVYPQGTHHRYTSRKTGKRVSTRNAVIGFVLAHGAPRRKRKSDDWMNKVNARNAAAVEAAEFAVYDRWLRENDL